MNKLQKHVAVAVCLLIVPALAVIYLRTPQYQAHAARELAEKGDAAAQYRTCLNYAIGVGVSKDMAEAARWALKAEAQNYHCREKLAGDVYDDLVAEMARQDKLAGRKTVDRHSAATE